MKEINLNDIGNLLLRLLSRPKHYFGEVNIKFYNGEIKNIKAEDSFDIEYLKEKKLIIEGDTEMFTKYGTGSKKDKNSSKILTNVELDEEQNIIKESKIVKEEKKEEIKVEKE